MTTLDLIESGLRAVLETRRGLRDRPNVAVEDGFSIDGVAVGSPNEPETEKDDSRKGVDASRVGKSLEAGNRVKTSVGLRLISSVANRLDDAESVAVGSIKTFETPSNLR